MSAPLPTPGVGEAASVTRVRKPGKLLKVIFKKKSKNKIAITIVTVNPGGPSEKFPGEERTSQFVHLPIGRVHDQHMRRFVTQGHDGARQRQGPSGLLVFALLIHKILQDTSLKIQHKVPVWRNHSASVFSPSKEEKEHKP